MKKSRPHPQTQPVERKEYVVRIEGKPNSFSVGAVVAENCAHFVAGEYDLPRDKAETLAKARNAAFPYLSRNSTA